MRRIFLEQMLNAIKHFSLPGESNGCIPYGNGHINDTFMVTCLLEDNSTKRYVLQAVNDGVFKKPQQVIDNIALVTGFLSDKVADPRGVMHMVPTKDGKNCYFDENNYCWRMYDYIEDSICLEMPESTDDFYQCAVAFGRFQRYLTEFPADKLQETIPDFHNTPKRFRDFLNAVETDACGRAKDVQEEIAFVKEREAFFHTLYKAYDAGELPLRVTHNDTKSNNVMLDADTRKALCVIDLDTVMPGFSVNDFGDAIRFGASTAAEDETDLNKVWLDLDLFEAYTKGFLEGCGGLLEESEIMLLPEGAKMMTVECGMRFLEDYLRGDTYFKTKYPEHNLVRCRTQFKLVADMEKHWDEMKMIVKKCLG